MKTSRNDPIDYFNQWFEEKIEISNNSVASIIDSLNKHSLSEDLNASNYVMPSSRQFECDGRFRVYGETQDTYYCFVYSGDELKTNPPVYFESCLELEADYKINPSDIIANDHVEVATQFSDFLWQILGFHICFRYKSDNYFAKEVQGVLFDGMVELGDEFFNPTGKEFPAGFTCFISDEAVCVPDWGAAFLNKEARDSFIAKYSPKVLKEWN